jgi:hypothetical protein
MTWLPITGRQAFNPETVRDRTESAQNARFNWMLLNLTQIN